MLLGASGGFPALGLRRIAGVERGANMLGPPQWFEVRIMACDRAVFRIELDRPQEEGHGFVDFIAKRQDRREHIERVIVVRRFLVGDTKVLERLVVPAGVDRKGCSEDPFFRCRGGCGPGRHVAVAHVEIQADTFVELPLLGVS